MALPSSGAISMGQVDTELGYSATAQISLNDTAVRSLFGIPSGAIDMNTGHGKTYNPGYTWYFPGNGNYVYINNPGNGAFDAQGGGHSSWCLEGWFYPYYDTNNQHTLMCAAGNGGAYGNGLDLEWYENAFNFYQGQNPSWSNCNSIVTGTSYPGSTWYHVAVVLYSGTVTMYVNGTAVTSTSDGSGGSTTTGNGFVINGAWDNRGRGYGGTQQYTYNLRWTQDNPVYTSNFTPQTTPLGTVSGTKLLTAQSSSFVDNSGNNWTINTNGTVTTQTSPHP